MKNILSISLVLISSIILSSCWENVDTSMQIVDEKQNDTFTEQLADDVSDEIWELWEKLLNEEITEEEAKKLMLNTVDESELMKAEFEKQKKQMPILLDMIKINRECLSAADNKSDVETCMSNLEEIVKDSWFEDFNEEDFDTWEFEWNAEEKKTILVEMDAWIVEMEKMLPCFENSENFSELMECSQK